MTHKCLKNESYRDILNLSKCKDFFFIVPSSIVLYVSSGTMKQWYIGSQINKEIELNLCPPRVSYKRHFIHYPATGGIHMHYSDWFWWQTFHFLPICPWQMNFCILLPWKSNFSDNTGDRQNYIIYVTINTDGQRLRQSGSSSDRKVW